MTNYDNNNNAIILPNILFLVSAKAKQAQIASPAKNKIWNLLVREKKKLSRAGFEPGTPSSDMYDIRPDIL